MTTAVAKSQCSIFSQIRDAIFYIGKKTVVRGTDITYLLYTTVYDHLHAQYVIRFMNISENTY